MNIFFNFDWFFRGDLTVSKFQNVFIVNLRPLEYCFFKSYGLAYKIWAYDEYGRAFESRAPLFFLFFNPYRTEKKSSLQDCSGFSEPLSLARIFFAFARYEHEFLDL